MRVVKLIKTEGKYIDNSTGDFANPTFIESSLDSIAGTGKYTFIELCTCLATFKAKTLKAIYTQIDLYTEQNNDFDFSAVIVA